MNIALEYKPKEPRNHSYIDTMTGTLLMIEKAGLNNVGIAMDLCSWAKGRGFGKQNYKRDNERNFVFMNAKWLSSHIAENDNVLYRFRKTVYIDKADGVTAFISADSRYKLYINDVYVCEGPCIGTHKYYDEVDISSYIKNGENKIEALVLYAGGGGLSCIQRKNRVAFIMEALRDGETVFSTDELWECALDKSTVFYISKHVHPNCYPNEIYKPEEIEWHSAVIPPFGTGDELWGVLPAYVMDKNPLKAYTPSKGIAMPISQSDIGDSLKIKKGSKGRVIFGLDKLSVGFPEFEFEGDAEVTVTYAESYRCADGFEKKVRSDTSGKIVGASDILTVSKSLVYRPYMTKTARYIKVEVDAKADFAIKRAEFLEYRYPLEICNNFECSDAVYNRIWDVSIHTLRNCMFDTYVDCPYYEMQQYSEDAYLEMMYTFMLSDDYRLPKKLITDFWQSQNYEGLQLAAAPMVLKQIDPTFNFFWIMMLEDYILYTGDTETVRPMLAGIFAIIEWFGRCLNKDGVVGVYKYGKFIDWVKTWKYGFMIDDADKKPTSISSLMYLYGLKAAGSLFRRFGKNGLADDMLSEYEKLKVSLNKAFYDEKTGMYKDTCDGGYSEHSQIWAVLSGAVSGETAKQCIQNSREEFVNKCSYSYQYFRNRAYDKCNIEVDMDEFLRDWKTMLKLDATTWFEMPGSSRSDCHGWSSVPIYEFTNKILGIQPNDDSFKSVTINPHFYNLEYAKGSVPTPFGKIDISWRKQDNKYEVKVMSPKEIKKIIVSENTQTYDENVTYIREMDESTGRLGTS